MKKLFIKSELWFALVWIIGYCILLSVGDNISNSIGFQKAASLPIIIIIAVCQFLFMNKNDLLGYYGFKKPVVPAKYFLFWIPGVIIFTINIWFGFRMNMEPLEAVVYCAFMIMVGFVEEVLFRGFLFNAMRKDNVKTAVIVSSITFGIGHIANFFNGNADLFSTSLQICYAIAVGFLFVTIYYRGGSIIPCIIFHSFNNALSTFANGEAITNRIEAILSMVLCVLSLLYALYIFKKTSLPEISNGKEL